MNRLYHIIFAFFIYLEIFPQDVQMAIEEWRSHLPYSQAKIVTEAEEKIYCATEGGLFYYNKEDNTVNKFTKIDGLSEIDISTVDYLQESDVLLIAYSNANIDIVQDNTIYNIPDIMRKQIIGNKTVNNIMFIGDYAYLSCGFGIVVLNLDKQEIKDTYYIGEDGGQLKVNDMTFDGTYLYAATDQGIYKADINSHNLIDYNYWHRIVNIPNYNKRFNAITYFNNKVYTNYSNETESRDTLYFNDNNIWKPFDTQGVDKIRSLNVCYDHLVVVSSYFTDIYDSNKNKIRHIMSNRPQTALLDRNDYVWIADLDQGLIKSEQGWDRQSIYPNGPRSNRAVRLDILGGKLYAVAGGVTSAWNNLFFHGELNYFINNIWDTYYTVERRDLFCLAIDPQDHNHVFAGSWGYGLLEFRDGELIEVYDDRNSTLQTIIEGGFFFRLGGLAFDRNNNLWVTNSGVPEPVSVRKPDGSWKSFSFDMDLNVPAIGSIIVTNYDHKWLLIPKGNGLFAFDVNGTIDYESDDKWLKFDVVDVNGKIISNNIFSLAEDLNGNIWVGTDKGVVVYYNPSMVFDSELFYGQQIIVPRNDGSGLADILLGTETVTAIAVDGANRKWVGTAKAGVFLLSDDGLEEIYNFNTDNSPLLSNNILDIAIDRETGNVFFATDKGIISFKSTAIDGFDEFTNVYVYPNPVREDYDGEIVISGLVKEANVKITDISGNIVYETTSLGGQAIWDGCNFSGEKVKTGVYLIFLTNENGSKTHITKLLFIN